MSNISLKSIKPHLFALAIFIIIAIIFCKPALQGKVLQQSDTTQWKAMYENQRQYFERHGTIPLWTNGMFSGMPGFQIAMHAPNPFNLGFAFQLLTLGLPKPFYFFILASVCFYILTQILKINPYLGIFGALSYAYATYNPIIVSVGHDNKMLAIAYMPAFIGSLMILYQRKYLLGLALTALFTGLMLSVNHPQIAYYTFIVAVFMSLAYVYEWIREKQYIHMLKSFSLAMAGGILGLLCNAVIIYTSYEYSKETIRGGSVLKSVSGNNTESGLSKDYAFSYSFFKTEPLVMMFPKFYGGSTGNQEVDPGKSKAVEALQQMPQELAEQIQGYLQYYWGGINSGTSGPPYSGAIICSFAILGLFYIPNRHKYWMFGVTILSFLMSWGLYFEQFNVFLLNNLPLYNKFRAPSMIMVIPTFVFSLATVLAAQNIFFSEGLTEKIKKFKKGLMVIASIFLFAILVYYISDFKTENDQNLITQVSQIPDQQQREIISLQVNNFIDALQEDRSAMTLSDIFRSLIYVLIAAIGIWLYLKNKINVKIALTTIAIFSMIDLFTIDSNYFNDQNFEEKEDNESIFIPAQHNIEIGKDTTNFRVLDLSNGISAAFNGNAITSIFHQSIGGYHAAKLSIYQDLIENQLYKFPDCMPTINMLNTKYIIYKNQQTGQIQYQLNQDAAGPCWLVDSINIIKDPAKVMSGLDSLNIKQTAIIETDLRIGDISKNKGDSIWLIKNDHDKIYYESNTSGKAFAVLSEVYYKHGWKAYIDDKITPIYKTNYVLRGLEIPPGKHKIRLEFKPQSYYNTVTISMIASFIIWALFAVNIYYLFKKNKKLI